MFVIRRDQTALPSFYKSPVQGDEVQFIAAQTGRFYVFENTADPVDRAARGITVPAVNTIDVQLPFTYFVGLRQLTLGVIDFATGEITQLVRRTDYPADGPVGAGFLVNTALAPNAVTFDEISSAGVRIYNTFAGDIFIAGYQHTSAPANLAEKVTIANQADNVAIDIQGPGDGILFRTPAGKLVRLYIHDGLGTAVDLVQ